AALAFSSCTKDNTAEPSMGDIKGGAKITAAIAADDTRTSLEKVDGKYEFRWSAGDQLGVYGVGGGLNNAAFVLNNDSDGKAVGVFSSQSTELKADKQYVAVYPRFQTSLFTSVGMTGEIAVPGTESDKAKYIQLEDVVMSIPATQKYQPETFYTGTVPAVSTEFFVNDDAANLSMQPVVDYLFVNIKSTEAISKLKLQLFDSSNQPIKLAGKGNLKRYILGDEYRFALNEVDGDAAIILEMDEAKEAVTCHTPNTYVFAIPAGILGMQADVRAWITVNDDKEPAFKLANKEGFYTNESLNYAKDAKGNKYGRKNDKGDWVMRQENTVFWANTISVDTDGDKKVDARGSFTYNPNNDYIIEHEGQLLKYLTEYNNTSVKDIYRKDAFICSEHVFDFSLQHMRELTTELKADGSYNDYQKYISNYLADGGTFPCIQGVGYVNEFKGNGAVITDIERPLQSAKGIFGEIKASTVVATKIGTINDVTFKNIGATVYDDAVLAGHLKEKHAYLPGVVLGSMGDGGKLIDVTVENASGLAILAKGNVAAYEALTIADTDELSYVIADMSLEKDLKFKNWDVVSAAGNVFGAVNAIQGEKDGHHVVTMPAGADYEKLAVAVGQKPSANGYALTWPAPVSNAMNTAKNDFAAMVTTDDFAVSVLIGDESYWTGDKIDLTITKDNSVGKKEKVYFVNYAEELANGAAGKDVQLARDMNLSYNYWSTPEYKSINGADNTITGIYMQGFYTTVAPFKANVFTNLNIDTVYISMLTSQQYDIPVPTKIAGLSLYAEKVDNVTVNDLTLKASLYYEAANNNSTEPYYSATYSTIGWLVAEGNNIYVTNSTVNGVQSNVRGLAGLVGIVNLKDNNSIDQQGGAQINNSSATIVAKAQVDLEEVEQFYAPYHKNVAGTVGMVVNATSNPKDIKFVGGETPVFTFDSDKGVTAVYGNSSKTYYNE
ncbi:MAG: hypothetical protein J6K33_07240, partial [Alistipes sp.]|nr:hypothetical protein [Alistipes sp.]